MDESITPMNYWKPEQLRTAADVRRMLRGEKPPEAAQGDVVSATIETVKEQPLKTTETVQTLTGSDLSGLDLTGEQKDALTAAGYGDRAALTAAVAAAGDNGLAGLSRATVRSLRRALDQEATPNG